MLLHKMKSIAAVCFVALCMFFSVSSAQADENKIPAELNSPFAQGDPNTAYAKYFIGNSYLKRLSSEGVSIANVTFEPRCRNNWHIHKATKGGGQILLITAGRGWYQEWGKEAQSLKTGDVVIITAGVKHWHGAAKDSWFVHLSVEAPGENTSNEWLEPVADEEYNKLP